MLKTIISGNNKIWGGQKPLQALTTDSSRGPGRK